MRARRRLPRAISFPKSAVGGILTVTHPPPESVTGSQLDRVRFFVYKGITYIHTQISGYLGLWMNREKTDFLTCGPWSGGTSVTLRLLEGAAGRWCHAAEELLGCRCFRAA